MALGGNDRLKKYFEKFGLMEESITIEERFYSRAAEFYRVKQRAACEGITFDVDSLSYEHGRESIPETEMRTNESLMPREL